MQLFSYFLERWRRPAVTQHDAGPDAGSISTTFTSARISRFGFTLTEALVATILLGLILAAGIAVIRMHLRDKEIAEFSFAGALLGKSDIAEFQAAMTEKRFRELRGYYHETWLHSAGQCANVEAAAWLLEQDFAIDARTDRGRTPLHYAIEFVWHQVAHDDLVRYVSFLIDRGAAVNTRDETGRTPLHAAAAKPEPSFALLLLKAGADPNAEAETSPSTALAIAAEQCHYSVVQTLITNGADVDGGSQRGEPLYLAAKGGHHAIVVALLDAGADPNGGLFVPLRGTQDAGHRNISQLLVKRGAAELPVGADAP